MPIIVSFRHYVKSVLAVRCVVDSQFNLKMRNFTAELRQNSEVKIAVLFAAAFKRKRVVKPQCINHLILRRQYA